MSYWRYLCLFADSGVQHILWCFLVLFVFVFFSCVPNVSSFSRLFIFDFAVPYSLTYISYGTPIVKRLESHIILKSTGASKPKALNRVAKIDYGYLCLREFDLMKSRSNIQSFYHTIIADIIIQYSCLITSLMKEKCFCFQYNVLKHPFTMNSDIGNIR